MATSDLSERILNAFPSGSYSLSAFLRLLDIVETDAVPTAAVECRIQPKLLINPAFVAKHANTPEKLLMLVMHELHHVLLGHTTLFPRMTPVQNFVFDAVINGIVCRMFPRADYTAMFEDFYSENHFPMCLLAPPPGWATDDLRMAKGIAELPHDQRKRAHEVHRALYSDGGASYQEVYELLPKLLQSCAPPVPGQSQETNETEQNKQLEALLKDVPLLGGHEDDDLQQGGLEQKSPVLFDVVRSVVEQWPQPPDPISGRSLADIIQQKAVQSEHRPSKRQQLRRLIRKVAGQDRRGTTREFRTEAITAPTPIPTMARRSLVLQALGQQVLLHPGIVNWRRRVAAGYRVHVYLDVSGSMNAVLKPLYGAILDCKELVHPTVHLFSTRVVDVTHNELQAGKCFSTGGTDIRCVTKHMQEHRVRHALLVTDGFVGKPKGEHRERLAKARLGVAYLGHGICESDLQDVTKYSTNLND